MSGLKNFKVAVIGGGVAGLASARYLLAEGFNVTLIEKRSELGGVWTGERFARGEASALYDGLETNVTCAMMTYTDQQWSPTIPLFPKDADVKRYLQKYAAAIQTSPDGVSSLAIQLGTEVADVRYVSNMNMWRVATKATDARWPEVSHTYIAVVVAAGSFNKPTIPQAESGRTDWEEDHPGTIFHSLNFQSAEFYKNKRVLIVGNGPSGIDIGDKIAVFAANVVISTRNNRRVSSGAQRRVGRIRAFNSRLRTVRFETGECLRFDYIIYCTGFVYDFHFLKKLSNRIFEADFNMPNLYQHIFYKSNYTLAFVGLPRLVPTFTVAEAQAAVVARVWSWRLPRPSLLELEKWEQEQKSTDPEQMAAVSRRRIESEYINELHKWSSQATAGDSKHRLEKLPPYYCRCMAHANALGPEVQPAYKAKGLMRFIYTTYESLGFRLLGRCPDENKKTACTCFIMKH